MDQDNIHIKFFSHGDRNTQAIDLKGAIIIYGNLFCARVLHESEKVKVAQLCLTLWDPMVHSLPGSSVHGTLQARILEWVAIPFCRGPSTQGWNLGLLHCRQILYCLSHQRSPITFLDVYNHYCNPEIGLFPYHQFLPIFLNF